MAIGSVTSANSTSNMKMVTAASTDPKIKSIQNEIKDTKQQLQNLSSKEELSANEKAEEKKKLQKGISRLNTELEQHQKELRKSQKREIRMAELQEDQKPAKEEESEDKTQTKEMSSDKTGKKTSPSDKQQAESQGIVISRNSDGTVILTGKVNQDEKSSIATEKNKDDETSKESPAEKKAKGIDSDTDASANTALSSKKMYAITSADASMQQANSQGTIIARTRDGIAILKGEINQDQRRGINTDEKQTQLEKMEERERRAVAFQASILGEAMNTMKSTAETNVTGANDQIQVNVENNAIINAMKAQEDQAAQQRFYVSLS